jgi:hypothetical protein
MPFQKEAAVRNLLAFVSGTLAALTLGAGIALAGNGPPALGFYVDGDLYRTIGTPTDLSGTGAPAHSFDTIYALGGSLTNVAEAAPGDSDYNGGRWMVLPVTWNVSPVQLTSAEDVLYYESQGWLSIGDEPLAQFVCPAIKQ